jgi:hypothetical protein
MAVKNYDPNTLIITFGATILDGYADGTFLSVEYNEDAYALTVGSNGEGCRSRSNNESATITFTLLQSSSVNDELSAYHNTDLLTGASIFPLLVRDINGTTVFAAETAWIRKFPTSAFDRTVGSREWVLETNKLNGFVGGSL